MDPPRIPGPAPVVGVVLAANTEPFGEVDELGEGEVLAAPVPPVGLGEGELPPAPVPPVGLADGDVLGEADGELDGLPEGELDGLGDGEPHPWSSVSPLLSPDEQVGELDGLGEGELPPDPVPPDGLADGELLGDGLGLAGTQSTQNVLCF